MVADPADGRKQAPMVSRKLRRAGLDYHEFAQVRRHANLAALLADQGHRRWLPCSTRGAQRYDTVHYSTQNLLIFGPETRGPASYTHLTRPTRACVCHS
mgnify:CR=1 FL=1